MLQLTPLFLADQNKSTKTLTIGTMQKNFKKIWKFKKLVQDTPPCPPSWYLAPSEDIGAGPTLCNDQSQSAINLKKAIF